MKSPISDFKGVLGSFKEISFYGHNSLMSQTDLFGQRIKRLAYDPRYIIFQGECCMSNTFRDIAVRFFSKYGNVIKSIGAILFKR